MRELLILELYEAIRVRQVVAYPIVIILFYDRDRQESVFKVMKNDHFLIFLDVWVSFWAGEGAAILELHQMVRVLQVAAYPADFILLFDRSHQLGVLKMLLF